MRTYSGNTPARVLATEVKLSRYACKVLALAKKIVSFNEQLRKQNPDFYFEEISDQFLLNELKARHPEVGCELQSFLNTRGFADEDDLKEALRFTCLYERILGPTSPIGCKSSVGDIL